MLNTILYVCNKTSYRIILILSLFLGSYNSAVFCQNFKTLDYLNSITGIKTIAGEHNREPNSEPAKWTDSIYSVTGKYPALWSGDFLYEANEIANRWTMIYEAKREWDKGAIIQLMLHTCPPTKAEPCPWSGSGGVLSSLTDAQWDSLITDGTTLNRNWKTRLDSISVYLQYLKNNGVEVLFRPLHEMNQSSFWWGGRPGPNGTAKLYRITHDYLVNVKGLTNIIWVWDLQDFSTLSSDVNSYDPGSSYWDILALDIYGSDGQLYTKSKYDIIVNKAGGKPIAIGECQVLPSPAILASQPRWSFFMGWSELVFSNNSPSYINTLYNSSNVITLNQMPGWDDYPASINKQDKIPGNLHFQIFQNYPNPFNPTTTISYSLPFSSKVKLDVYNEIGQKVATLVNGEITAGLHSVDFNGSSLASGIYFYRIQTGNFIEVKKLILLK